MKNIKKPITPTEARRSLNALDILSGKVTEPPKPRKKPIQHEAKIQADLFTWANLAAGSYPELKLLHHIPNGGSRNAIEAANLKKQGTKSGVPDLCLPVARSIYHGLYIELKAEGGRLQDTQKTWISELNKQNYKAVVCFGFDEAKTIIENYLKGDL